ncbi:hypothetical protein ABC382_00245 [Lysinibacillus sp. 1P01SD]|uniref:hypothetical protein n=1 Tax=Lysinibacillus sp. 1P01SD TaxID=3132285 RepID=UPI00399FE978
MKIHLKNVEDLTKEILTNEYNSIQNPNFTEEELMLCLKKFSKNDMHFMVTSDTNGVSFVCLTGKAYINQQCVLNYDYDSNVQTVKDMISSLIVEKVFVPLIIDYCYCSKTTETWMIELI